MTALGFGGAVGGGSFGGLIGAILPHHDTGVWNVPFDHAAVIHRGEMVVPAAQAETMRSGSGTAGGVTVNAPLTISAAGAMDAASLTPRSSSAMCTPSRGRSPTR